MLHLKKNENLRKIHKESLIIKKKKINEHPWRRSKMRLRRFILGSINRIRRLRSCKQRYNCWSRVCSRLLPILRRKES